MNISLFVAPFKLLIYLHFVGIRTSEPVGNFLKDYVSQASNMPESKILSALTNDCFAVPFIHLELRREYKEDYLKVGESKVGKSLLDYRIVNKILCCSLEDDYFSEGSEKEDYSWHFKGMLA